jgi:hypothetical protein
MLSKGGGSNWIEAGTDRVPGYMLTAMVLPVVCLPAGLLASLYGVHYPP